VYLRPRKVYLLQVGRGDPRVRKKLKIKRRNKLEGVNLNRQTNVNPSKLKNIKD
jgi:hypothetical protein